MVFPPTETMANVQSSMSPEARGRKRGSGRQERPQPNQQNGDEGTIAKEGRAVDPGELLVPPRLPKHPTNDKVNRILERCQEAITAVYAKKVEPPLKPPSSRGKFQSSEDGKERGLESKIFSNANVDLGKIDVVGFDYDYTLESEVNRWRDIQEHVINANFGSIFRAGDAVSKFAASMRRHADLYTSSVENLRFYSTEQRFYPDGGHESVPFNDPLLDYIIGDDSALL
eukprot:jgi/Bigna1/137307/aug1.38_g12015